MKVIATGFHYQASAFYGVPALSLSLWHSRQIHERIIQHKKVNKEIARVHNLSTPHLFEACKRKHSFYEHVVTRNQYVSSNVYCMEHFSGLLGDFQLHFTLLIQNNQHQFYNWYKRPTDSFARHHKST